MKADQALVDDIRVRVHPDSRLTGPANLLVMPNMDCRQHLAQPAQGRPGRRHHGRTDPAGRREARAHPHAEFHGAPVREHHGAGGGAGGGPGGGRGRDDGGLRSSSSCTRPRAARALPKLGFPTSDAYAAQLEPWTRLVLGACVAAPDGKGSIQDNRALPEIRDGIERLFGAGSAAALIVQAVLLHQSLNVVPEWPNPGSLAEDELPACIRPALLPLLEALMLVDSDAWQLFESTSRAKFRASTLAVFANVRRVLGK